MSKIAILASLLFAPCVVAAQPFASLSSRLIIGVSVRDYSAACDGVTDDSKALSAAASALAGSDRSIFIAGNCRLLLGPAARLAGQPVTLDGVGMIVEGGRDSGYPYGNR
jgi:hypothetical protein